MNTQKGACYPHWWTIITMRFARGRRLGSVLCKNFNFWALRSQRSWTWFTQTIIVFRIELVVRRCSVEFRRSTTSLLKLTLVWFYFCQFLHFYFSISLDDGDAVRLLAGQRTCDSQVAGWRSGWPALRSGLGQTIRWFISYCSQRLNYYKYTFKNHHSHHAV